MTGVSVPRLVVIEPEVRSLSQNTETLQIMVPTAVGIRAQMRSQNNYETKGDMCLVGWSLMPRRPPALQPGGRGLQRED